MREWGVSLEGVYLSGGSDRGLPDACVPLDPAGCLPSAPDGLGNPPLRTEDVAFPQRDGEKHYSDWYEPRIVTLEGVTVCPDGCGDPLDARRKVAAILDAWSRKCGDVELVIYTPANDTPGPRTLRGPFGIVGRPRVATVSWIPGTGCAELLLRFDAADDRMFLLDACGTPGSGVNCTIVGAGQPASKSRCYPRCTTTGGGAWCYDHDTGGGGGTPMICNTGTLEAWPTITLEGPLTTTSVINVDTGERLDYNGVILAGDPPVVIDTFTGTATQDGQPRTHLLGGDTQFTIPPSGCITVQLAAYGAGDDGTATICFRPAVRSA